MDRSFKLVVFIIFTFIFLVENTNGQKININPNYNLYKKALLNCSTAPNYILISVQVTNKDSELICIEAPFLLGAIHREFGFDYSNEGENEALDYALKRKSMTFSFHNNSAKQNIKPRYSQEILEEVINYFSNITTDALLNGQNSFKSYLIKIGNTKRKDFTAYRDAMAFLLLTRNILPTRGCVAGNLYVSDENRPLQVINFSSYIGLQFSNLLESLGNRKYDYQFIDEPPLKLIGCLLSFEDNKRIIVYFRDISSQAKFKSDGNWDFDKLKTEIVESIKAVDSNM